MIAFTNYNNMKLRFIQLFIGLIFPFFTSSQTSKLPKNIFNKIKKECHNYVYTEYPEADIKFKEKLCKKCYLTACSAYNENKNKNKRIEEEWFSNSRHGGEWDGKSVNGNKEKWGKK